MLHINVFLVRRASNNRGPLSEAAGVYDSSLLVAGAGSDNKGQDSGPETRLVHTALQTH